MLERMWREGNSHTLLVGVQTGAATMENSTAIPQKIKTGGRPRGLEIKCARSAAGGPGSDPGRAPTHRLSDHAVAASHIKWRKMGTDVSSGSDFLSKKKEEDWHGC